MSLHRQSQFQRAHRQETADSCRSPLFLSGDICPSMLATGWCVAFGAAPRPVNRPLGPSSIRVNNLFAILFQKLFAAPETALTRGRKWGRNREIQGLCRRRRKCRAVRGVTIRRRNPAGERANPCADRSSNIDSIRESIERDRILWSLPMMKWAIPFAGRSSPSGIRMRRAIRFDPSGDESSRGYLLMPFARRIP